MTDDRLPPRSDWHDVPEELVVLDSLGEPVVVTQPDSVSFDALAVVPALHAHARRLEEG